MFNQQPNGELYGFFRRALTKEGKHRPPVTFILYGSLGTMRVQSRKRNPLIACVRLLIERKESGEEHIIIEGHLVRPDTPPTHSLQIIAMDKPGTTDHTATNMGDVCVRLAKKKGGRKRH